VLGVILFFGGLERAASVTKPPASQTDRTVLVMTAGVALWNMGLAYVAGLLVHYAARAKVIRLDEPD
jgi:hypothetical protein